MALITSQVLHVVVAAVLEHLKYIRNNPIFQVLFILPVH
jgi:hypothetical protein